MLATLNQSASDLGILKRQHALEANQKKNTRMTTFHIPDMNCGHRKAMVKKTIHALDPAARFEFDMAAQRISVEGW